LEYLKKILASKKNEIKDLSKNLDKEKITSIRVKDDKTSFIKKIRKNKVNVIAEIKKASPSLGVINDSIDIEKVALLYSKYKSFISGISVVTESIYFRGSLEYIKRVKKVSDLPILRKDFIFHQYQIYESLISGADCILLISSILGYKKLKKLYEEGKSLGIDVLVEVHSKRELDRALDIGADFIGINNRNLKNMKVDPATTFNILRYASKKNITGKIFTSESGVENIEYMKGLYNQGVDTFLIGGYFMKSKNLDVTLNKMETGLREENLI